MTEQEIIKAWKENEKPFGLCSLEMQEWAKENMGLPWQIYDERWEGWAPAWKDKWTYRLSPYYQPEPEVIEVPIVGATDGFMRLWNNVGELYVCAPTIARWQGKNVRFAGYKYADGTVIKSYVKGDHKNYQFPTHALFIKA